MRSLFLLVTLVATTAAQSLQWEQPTLAIESIEGAGKVAGAFRFTNTGHHIVRIRSVPASCGCVVAQPAKRDYAPGESGEIPFTYSPKGRWGARAYRVYVVTDEEGIRPYQLRLEVTEIRRADASQ